MPSSKWLKGEINPDGVPINVVWRSFAVGTSVFIPAVNITRLARQMQYAARKRNMTLRWAERIEGGKLGARFWRLL